MPTTNLKPTIRKEKESVRQYWDKTPCGTGNIPYPDGSLEYFEAIAEKRYRLEPFIGEYAQFDRWAGKKMLEVGCGAGTDLLRFARAGAQAVGIDLSPKSAFLAKSRLSAYNCQADVLVADAENLPFKGDEFELIYSWGVLHHTPNPERVIREIYRVTKSGGEICIMLYHRHSLVAWQLYLLFGVLALRPYRSLKDILANHHESPGTKAYTVAEARQMFSAFKELDIRVRLTPYDLRYKRNRYLPRWVGKLVPKRLGWFIVIKGRKP
ncbi:MAG: class I SAM-dependent methyltransferase [Dehalococcoidales bacterium]